MTARQAREARPARTAAKQALLHQLELDGHRYVFGNPGTTGQGFMDALQDHPKLTYVVALHEAVAIATADAYARVTGRPAFAQVHTRPSQR